MEIVKEEEWEKGIESGGNEERRKKIIKVMVGRNGYSSKILKEKVGNWVYSELIKMEKEGILERRKFGKKYMYRKIK